MKKTLILVLAMLIAACSSEGDGNGDVDNPPTPPAITTTTLADATAGVAYNAAITASGGTGAGYTWTVVAGSLPSGLTLGATGTPGTTITGTPTGSGVSTFTVQVTDSGGKSATADLQVNLLNDPLAITTLALPNAKKGEAYSQVVAAIGGTAAGYTWAITGGSLPVGMTLASSGTPETTISGTPTGSGSAIFTVQVMDSLGATATANLQFDVLPALTIATLLLPDATVGQPYSAMVMAFGGSAAGYTWTITTGALPGGLTLGASGTPDTTITGTPTVSGLETFTVQVTDSLSDTATANLQINVLPGPLSIVTAPDLPDGTVGQAYSDTISAEGGTGTGYTWSVLGGEFPTGLTLTPTGNPATLTGTPTVFGRFNFTVQVEDSAATTETLDMQLIVIIAGTSDTWPATFSLAPDRGDCAVFTGTRILQFGGEFGASNGGEVMTPGAGTVTPMTTTNAPTARVEGTGVWTGREMIVWGGRDLNTYFNTGGRYNPDTDTWTTVTTTGAPSSRTQHSAVWTGTEMIIFGGYDGSFAPMNDGAAYNPAADSWRPLAAVPTGFAGRERHAAVWTGTHMIIWGGLDSAGNGMFDGAVYDPVGNSWTLMSTTNAPEVWAHHAALIWTGSDLFVWGGHYMNAHNDGRRWDPVSNTWSMQGTYHIIRREFAACATSGGVFVWGGLDHFGTFAQNDGEFFNFGINNWQGMATPPLFGRFNVKAWWTGRQVILWGGKEFGFSGTNPLSDGAVYIP